MAIEPQFVLSLDDRALAGLFAQLPVSELDRLLEPVLCARPRVSLEFVAVAVARLRELPPSRQSELLALNSPLRAGPLGRWVLAESWLAASPTAAEAVALWSELVEQAAPGEIGEAYLGRAQARRSAGDVDGCIGDLLEVARRSGDYKLLSKAARLLDRVVARGAKLPGRAVKVALVSSSTTELVPPLLRLLAARDGIAAEIYCAPFGTYRQELLDPNSGLHAAAPDVVVIALHWRDAALAALSNTSDGPDRLVGELQQLWAGARQHRPCTILQHTFDLPAQDSAGYLSTVEPTGRATHLREINRQLLALREPGVLMVDLERLAFEEGAERWSDDALWHVAKQHPSAVALPRLVGRYIRLIAARVGLAKKVAVLDLDNTLWAGVVGEDGPHGIKIGPPTPLGEAHAAFQRYLRELKERGVLLAVCSKNNEADAREPFTQTLGMELKLEDFVAFVANWEEKSENLKRIARSLNVGTDSLVFIDDNPLERAKVRRELPEVAVVELPRDAAGFIAALDRGAYFEALALSAEDLARNESYRANSQRAELREKAGDVESFLRNLDMRMHHGPFDDSVQERAVQLFNKTNQFNLTTRRHGAEEVAAMRADPQVWTQSFRLVDCFGDNGVIGLLVARPADEADWWEIDSFLMSCRVLGRQAEEFMLATLLAEANRRGVRRVRGRYFPTPKNGMVSDLYARLGFQLESKVDNGETTWLWDLKAQPVKFPTFVRSVGA